jgi:hypothetical protein
MIDVFEDWELNEITVSSITEYVDYIEKIDGLSDLWFRGVSNENYKPQPGLVWQGCQEHEATFEHRFLVSYKSYIEDTSLSSWEVYALMQHHGLPTRLLDWSESALVALYFALASEPKSKEYSMVWVLSPYQLNEINHGNHRVYCPAEMRDPQIPSGDGVINIDSYLPPNLMPSGISNHFPSKPIAINASQHLKRVSSQKGCFTVHGANDDSVDTYMEGNDSFHAIKIDARTEKNRLAMLAKLGKLGIDEEFIYQDLDSLCKRIKRQMGINL